MVPRLFDRGVRPVPIVAVTLTEGPDMSYSRRSDLFLIRVGLAAGRAGPRPLYQPGANLGHAQPPLPVQAAGHAFLFTEGAASPDRGLSRPVAQARIEP